MTIAEEKQELRRRVRALERTLSPRYKACSDAAIAAAVCALPDYQEAETVFCFAGTEREIDTGAILRDALARGSRRALPPARPAPPAELLPPARQARSFSLPRPARKNQIAALRLLRHNPQTPLRHG